MVRRTRRERTAGLPLSRWRPSWRARSTRGIRPSTIGRRVAAIRYAHKLAGHPPPTDDERVKATVRGIRRTPRYCAPQEDPGHRRAHHSPWRPGTGDGLKGLRDRALLLLGFAGAFRRSELVALDCEDIEECETGLRITIRHSKTDQEGAGATIAIVRGTIACPVAALKAWLRCRRHYRPAPLFRSIRKGGKVGARLTDAVRRRRRQSARRARRARSRAVRRPLAASRVPHISPPSAAPRSSR